MKAEEDFLKRFSFQDLLLLSFKTFVYNWAIPSCRSSDLVEKR